MITRSLLALGLLGTMASAASAEYDTAHQIIYSKQMLQSDIHQHENIKKTLEKDLLRLKIEQNRQDNEQLSYERLVQQEEDIQSQIDEAKTPQQKEKAVYNRDNLRSSLGHTRIWLAAHEQNVMKADALVHSDMDRLNTLEETISRLAQVLRNDGVKPDASTKKTKSL